MATYELPVSFEYLTPSTRAWSMGYKDRPMLPDKNRCQDLTYIHVTGRIHLGHFFVDPLHWKPMLKYLDFWEQIKFSLILYDWLDCHIIDQTICYLSNFSGSSALYKSGFCTQPLEQKSNKNQTRMWSFWFWFTWKDEVVECWPNCKTFHLGTSIFEFQLWSTKVLKIRLSWSSWRIFKN